MQHAREENADRGSASTVPPDEDRRGVLRLVQALAAVAAIGAIVAVALRRSR